MDYKIAHGTELQSTQCLFCVHEPFASIEEYLPCFYSILIFSAQSIIIIRNVEHMAREHSFSIPDVDFVADMNALLHFFALKVGVGNACVYCDKVFVDIHAVRSHMKAKAHTKVPLGAGQCQMTLSLLCCTLTLVQTQRKVKNCLSFMITRLKTQRKRSH